MRSLASLAIAALVVLASACSADTSSRDTASGAAASAPATTPAIERAVTTTDFVPGDISATQTTAPPLVEGTIEFDAAIAYRDGVETLLAAPSVRVDFEGTEHEYRTTGSVEMDLTTGNYRSTESETHETGDVVDSEYVLTGDTIYVRFGHTGDAVTEVEWSVNPIGDQRQDFVDNALTMFGRAGGSLERIALYLDSLPFEAEALGTAEIGGQTATGYQLAFDSLVIAAFLRTEQLETIGPSNPGGQSFYEFWIDEAGGQLVRLAIGGVQYHDGEPITGFGGELTYAVGPAITVTPPA